MNAEKDLVMENEKWFPVGRPMTAAQALKAGPSPLRIPWSVAEKAYFVYAGRYGRGQTMERLAERGGFYAEELDDLYPGWRVEASEIAALRVEVARLTAGPDPSQPDDPHVDRLVDLITKSLADGGCSNCGGFPHSKTCRVGRLAAAFHSSRAASAPDEIATRAEALWEELGGDLCICQRPDVPHWCESCQRRIELIDKAFRRLDHFRSLR